MAEQTERAVLNHLIEICRDGERGFRHLVDHVSDPSLKAMFDGLAGRRAQFAADLLPHAQRLGGAIEHDGTPAGALHRGWMSLMEVITHDDKRALLREAERGEGAAETAYKNALEGMLPPTVRELVEQQYAELKGSHERVRALLVH